MKAQEEDRRRISRELHDSIGQYLTSLKLGIADVSSDEQCNDAMREKLNECARLVRICMEEIRSVSNLLHPPLLDILGLVPALRWYARYFSERSAISLELDTPQDMERLDQDTELTLFRIFQECLTNIQRHAQTSHAKVRLRGDEQAIVLEVEDSGIGMPPDIFQQMEIRGSGIGLFKMRERVAELFGKLEFHSSEKGTLVRARIPKSKARAIGPAYSEESRRAAPKRMRSE
jgi:signal transduction histidine kinase